MMPKALLGTAGVAVSFPMIPINGKVAREISWKSAGMLGNLNRQGSGLNDQEGIAFASYFAGMILSCCVTAKLMAMGISATHPPVQH